MLIQGFLWSLMRNRFRKNLKSPCSSKSMAPASLKVLGSKSPDSHMSSKHWMRSSLFSNTVLLAQLGMFHHVGSQWETVLSRAAVCWGDLGGKAAFKSLRRPVAPSRWVDLHWSILKNSDEETAKSTNPWNIPGHVKATPHNLFSCTASASVKEGRLECNAGV